MLTYADVCCRETRETDLREAISPHAQILGRIKFVGKSSALVTLASAATAQAVCAALEASQMGSGSTGRVRSVPYTYPRTNKTSGTLSKPLQH